MRLDCKGPAYLLTGYSICCVAEGSKYGKYTFGPLRLGISSTL